jgi:hypothetical protein
MAGPERFELPTSSFEDLLSIQLNYGPINLAPGVGIEPTIAESKSVVLPLHYPGSKGFLRAQLSSWKDSLDCLDRASLHYRHSRLRCHTADLNCTRLAGLKPCVYLRNLVEAQGIEPL